MSKKIIVSAFSFNMIPTSVSAGEIKFTRLSKEKAGELLKTGFVAGIGHDTTAPVVAADLGHEGNLFSRTTLVVNPGDELLLCQYSGPRLAEGATALPPGAKLEYLHITVG